MTLFSRLFYIAVVVLGFCFQAQAAEPATIRILNIGNSFSDDATAFLPSMAKSAGTSLHIGRASLAGHSLKQHAGYIAAYEVNSQDTVGSPYNKKIVAGKATGDGMSLRAILESEPWDFVTIQQASIDSFKPETYEPYAKTIIDYIHKYAPKAEIVVHQTWAYREDNPVLIAGKLTQMDMYTRLVAAYDKLAADYHLRQIPSGDAMQMARALPHWTFVPDPAFDYQNPPAEGLPNEKGGLNLGWSLKTDPETGKVTRLHDAKHCNTDGRYLTAAVMYQTLVGDVEKVTFIPPKLTPEDAATLRGVAKDAVAKKQTGKVSGVTK